MWNVEGNLLFAVLFYSQSAWRSKLGEDHYNHLFYRGESWGNREKWFCFSCWQICSWNTNIPFKKCSFCQKTDSNTTGRKLSFFSHSSLNPVFTAFTLTAPVVFLHHSYKVGICVGVMCGVPSGCPLHEGKHDVILLYIPYPLFLLGT